MYNLFATPVEKVKITPTTEQYEKTVLLLNRMFNDVAEHNWALETGKSTGELGLDLHDCPEIWWLVDQALEHARQYWKVLGYRHTDTIIPESSWANVHKINQTTGEHAHCGGFKKAHISTVYYLNKPLNSGHIEFVDPLEYIHRMTPVHEFSERTGTYSEFTADEHDLILFPSWLKHRTQANSTDQNRIAISINFIGIW
jgi:uncharacterized protein (TIGR02466 family)